MLTYMTLFFGEKAAVEQMREGFVHDTTIMVLPIRLLRESASLCTFTLQQLGIDDECGRSYEHRSNLCPCFNVSTPLTPEMVLQPDHSRCSDGNSVLGGLYGT